MLAGLLLPMAAIAVYLGSVGAAFAALMRLSLRLLAERGSRSSRLGAYLDDPVQLFLPVRAMLGAVHVAVALLFATVFRLDDFLGLARIVLCSFGFILLFEHLLPYLIVRRNPEGVLDSLLPSFDVVAGLLRPLLLPFRALLASLRERPAPAQPAVSDEEQLEATTAYLDAGEQEGLIERDERQLLQSIVDFGDTLVHEVMTPRPDIVAIRAQATLAELRTFFRDQEYSRIPVYVDSLDNILGFVFIKDLMRLPETEPPDRPVSTLVRPAYVVPETKRVSDLLREFQRQQWQIAIVVDEYGGTAGLVTFERLMERIVGEIGSADDSGTSAITVLTDGSALIDGLALTTDVNVQFGLQIDEDLYDTIGGYVLGRLGRRPRLGDSVEVGGRKIRVEALDGLRVARVLLSTPA
jgi:CBS domain containing-hemolysin-like protein